MLVKVLHFVLETLGHLWILALLLRLFAQLTRVPLRARAGNPLADFVMALTDWAVLPVRRLLPALGRIDVSTAAIAWIAATLLALALLALQGRADLDSPLFWPGLVFYGFVSILRLIVYLYIGLLILQAVLSWFSTYHPMRPFFDGLTKPMLRPIQRLIPLVGGVDLSPLLAIILLQIILMAPLEWLGFEALRLVLASG